MSGRVVWITGRPATGKTTLAKGVLAALEQRGVATLWLDSDDLRPYFTPNATYTDADRDRFYAAVGHVAELAAAGGVTVIVSATASKRQYRDAVRQKTRFLEIWITCDRDVLRQRDIKGLYQKAEAGEIDNLPGVGAEFETPTGADLVLDSGKRAREELVSEALRVIDGR